MKRIVQHAPCAFQLVSLCQHFPWCLQPGQRGSLWRQPFPLNTDIPKRRSNTGKQHSYVGKQKPQKLSSQSLSQQVLCLYSCIFYLTLKSGFYSVSLSLSTTTVSLRFENMIWITLMTSYSNRKFCLHIHIPTSPYCLRSSHSCTVMMVFSRVEMSCQK